MCEHEQPIRNGHSRMKFRAFPTGPNGFRMVEGRELNPESPRDNSQARFDELVQVVNNYGGGSASFFAEGESEKSVNVNNPTTVKSTLTPTKKIHVRSEKTPQEEKLRRQQENMSLFTGFRRGIFYRNGVPSKK